MPTTQPRSTGAHHRSKDTRHPDVEPNDRLCARMPGSEQLAPDDAAIPSEPAILDESTHVAHADVPISCSRRIAEDGIPQPGKSEIVLSPHEYIKVRKWHITRVFYFLVCSSALCLTAVMLVPGPTVEATAVAVLAASVSLAKFLLSDAHLHSGRKDRRPDKRMRFEHR
jgi:hypothetical protein